MLFNRAIMKKQQGFTFIEVLVASAIGAGIGGLLQGQQQSQLDATRANQLQQMYEPYQRHGFFSDLLRGVPSSGQTVTSATAPSTTNPFATALGYGLTGLGIAGQLGYQPFGNPTAFANPYAGGVSPSGMMSGIV